MLISIIRTIIIYVIVVIILRLMGKRQIGQLQPFELVVVLMISDMAAIPSQNTGIPLTAGLVPVTTLLILGIAISQISLKSQKARDLICGKPTIIVANGKILEDRLRDLRYNLSDLLEQLRVDGIYNLADVDYAILETNGQLSVMPKGTKRPLTPQDMNLTVPDDGLPYHLIMDGQIQYDNLQKAGRDEKWLQKQLETQRAAKAKDVLFASLDSQGQFFLQKKDKR